MTISQIHKQLTGKEVSCKEMVRGFLDEIKKKDKDIHAYLEVDEEGAMKQAEEVDAKIEKGEEIAELTGVPIAVKDNILTKGFNCTAGSKILEN